MMKRKKKKSISLNGILDVVAVGILVATVFGYLGRFNWFFDLFSHFRVQYLQLCLIPFIVALWQRRNKLAIGLVLLVCLNYTFVLPLYFGKPGPAKSNTIRAMLMNILAENGNTDQVLSAIKMADPDLLLLEEVTPQWAQELEVLNTTYRHRIAKPQNGCFGMMLLSKVPLEHGEIVEIGTSGVPSIIAEAHFPQGVISVLGTHPLPPIGAAYSNQRNSQLAALPNFVKQQKYPVLLIGDLNTTPWSSYFQTLEKESGLKNSMQGFGHQPSWPSGNAFLRIPLDHILHDEEITIHNRMVGPKVGSDHLPVIVDFSIR
jgi:endonuclease/exonuclease/phosphatase (EEP) superfamily protein YafD